MSSLTCSSSFSPSGDGVASALEVEGSSAAYVGSATGGYETGTSGSITYSSTEGNLLFLSVSTENGLTG